MESKPTSGTDKNGVRKHVERLCKTHYVCEMLIDVVVPVIVAIPRRSATKDEAKDLFIAEAKRIKVAEAAKVVNLRMHW